MSSDSKEKIADFFLKENDKGQCTYADQFVENGAEQLHFQNLGYKKPENHEYQYAEKNIQRT